jgi:hypothetical protein
MRLPRPPLPEGITPIPIDLSPGDLIAEAQADVESAEATPDNTEALDQAEQKLAVIEALVGVGEEPPASLPR